VQRGDLVRCSGACYDAPINHHEAALAIRHYAGYYTEAQTGVVVDIVAVYSRAPAEVSEYTSTWYQVLSGGQVVWLNSACVRRVDPCI
jgi:hypothetical protein